MTTMVSSMVVNDGVENDNTLQMEQNIIQTKAWGEWAREEE